MYRRFVFGKDKTPQGQTFLPQALDAALAELFTQQHYLDATGFLYDPVNKNIQGGKHDLILDVISDYREAADAALVAKWPDLERQRATRELLDEVPVSALPEDARKTFQEAPSAEPPLSLGR